MFATPPRPPSARSLQIATALFGLQAWLTLLVLPMAPQARAGDTATALAICGVPALVMVCGLTLTRVYWLLVAFPAAMAAALTLRPDIVDLALRGPWPLGIACASLTGYSLLAARLVYLRRVATRALKVTTAPLVRGPSQSKATTAAMRLVWAVALLSPLALCAALLHGLYLQEAIWARWSAAYPDRVAEAGALGGALVVCLWLLAVDRWRVAARQVLRGEPRLRAEIQGMRRRHDVEKST